MVRIGFKKTILPGKVGDGWWEGVQLAEEYDKLQVIRGESEL